MRSSRALLWLGKDGAKMSTRLVRGTANLRGRNIFVNPDNSSMRQVSYGRIRLHGDLKNVRFENQGQETGLICIKGACEVLTGGQSFTLTRGDALYIPKGLSATIQTASEVDLVECFAPVEGEYPLQYVSGEAVRKDEKLHFVAGNRERSSRDQHSAGQQYSGRKARGGHYTFFPGQLDELASA